MSQFSQVLTSERLRIEPLCSQHAASLFDALLDERIYRWISTAPPTSVNQLQVRYAALAAARSALVEPLDLGWAVRRKVDGVYVGKFDSEVVDGNRATNIGYIIFPEFWHQGYASEALHTVVEHLGDCGVTEQRAFVTYGNTISERLLSRCAFERVRMIPNNDTIRGELYDDVEYIWRR